MYDPPFWTVPSCFSFLKRLLRSPSHPLSDQKRAPFSSWLMGWAGKKSRVTERLLWMDEVLYYFEIRETIAC